MTGERFFCYASNAKSPLTFSTIVLATGYTRSFRLVKLPVVDADGYLSKEAVWPNTTVCIGLIAQPEIGTSVRRGNDAAYLATHLAVRHTEQSDLPGGVKIRCGEQMKLVEIKTGSKRMRKPRVLTVKQYHLLLPLIPEVVAQ